jgi:hypothetical protein
MFLTFTCLLGLLGPSLLISSFVSSRGVMVFEPVACFAYSVSFWTFCTNDVFATDDVFASRAVG